MGVGERFGIAHASVTQYSTAEAYLECKAAEAAHKDGFASRITPSWPPVP